MNHGDQKCASGSRIEPSENPIQRSTTSHFMFRDYRQSLSPPPHTQSRALCTAASALGGSPSPAQPGYTAAQACCIATLSQSGPAAPSPASCCRSATRHHHRSARPVKGRREKGGGSPRLPSSQPQSRRWTWIAPTMLRSSR